MTKLLMLVIYIWSILCTAGARKLHFSSLRRAAASAIVSLAVFELPATCFAESRVVGNIQTSGLIFKDTLKVTAFDDPKVQGVTLYISDFDRPVIEKLGNIFDDPSTAGLACVQTGPIVVKGIEKGEGGEEVFDESKNLIFKQIRVRRILDPKKNALVYTAYSTRLDKNADQNKSRFKSSLCAVSLYTPVTTYVENASQ